MDYPAFPWRLRPHGVALGTLHPLKTSVARAYVPRPFRLLPVLPGHTLGGLFLVHYGPGSELEYRELVACAGLVRHGGRICAWVSHVYVDDAVSLRGGREALGVPKRLARFRTTPDGRGSRVATEDGRPICTIRRRALLRLWRRRIRFCAAHRHAEDRSGALVSVHGNEISGRLVVGRASVEVPPESPLRALGLGPALLAGGMDDAEALFGGAPFLPFHVVRSDTG